MSLVDSTRSNGLYIAGLAALTVASLALNSIPQLAVSPYVTIPHQRLVSAVLLALGGLAGALAGSAYYARQRAPWKVPQSRVSLAYAAFMVFTGAGVALSH